MWVRLGLYVVPLLDQTFKFDWYMARLVIENRCQKISYNMI